MQRNISQDTSYRNGDRAIGPKYEDRTPTPIQSLVDTIAQYIHDPNATKGDDVSQWETYGQYGIQYGVGPDDNHETRTQRVLSVTDDQAVSISLLIHDAWHAGFDAGWNERGKR